ncbi:MFS transporter [Rhodobacteraceae bacterium NNCM2]|nr:MFS transporter [Coraliihabitans acroporae]
MTDQQVAGGFRDWIAPIIAMAVAGMSISYLWPLFALLQEREGFSGLQIGLNATASALTMVAAAPVMPRLMARFGIIRLMVVSSLVLGAGVLAAPLFYDFWWWTLLRMIFGFTGTALFFAAEYWLVETAPPGRRGRIVAIYAIVLSVSYGVGPALLRMLGMDSAFTFVLPAVLIASGAIPILVGRQSAPPAREEEAASPAETFTYFRSDPLILWGVVLFGMIEFGAMGLLSVWAVKSGLVQADALMLLSWLAVGSILFQFVIGWAADTYDRRKLLAMAGALSFAAPVIMVLMVGNFAVLIVCAIIWGGMAAALYTLALTELGARYEGHKLAAGNAAVVLAYGIGAFMAPASFGWAMDWIPPDGLMWLAAASAGAYTLLALWRLAIKPRNPLDMGG